MILQNSHVYVSKHVLLEPKPRKPLWNSVSKEQAWEMDEFVPGIFMHVMVSHLNLPFSFILILQMGAAED